MEVIRDLLWLWILGAVGGTGYILWALFVRDSAPAQRPAQQITTRRTPAAPPPVARPAGSPPASGLPTRTPPVAAPAASGEHQRRGSAPTVKLPSADVTPERKTSVDDRASAELFAGLSAAKAKADAAPPIVVPAPPQLAPPKDIAERAVRLEERGFHVGAAKTADPEAKPAEAKPAGEVPGQPRTQTQELDDILKRIDAVLSESGAPASEATMTNPQGQSTMPLPQSPPTEKLERKATDPNQQKLF